MRALQSINVDCSAASIYVNIYPGEVEAEAARA